MTKKTIHDIANKNNFKIITAYAKPQKHGGEYSYLRMYSRTWPYLVLTYQGMTRIASERTGVQNIRCMIQIRKSFLKASTKKSQQIRLQRLLKPLQTPTISWQS